MTVDKQFQVVHKYYCKDKENECNAVGKGEETSLESWLRKLNDKEPPLQRREQPFRQIVLSLFCVLGWLQNLTLAVIS